MGVKGEAAPPLLLLKSRKTNDPTVYKDEYSVLVTKTTKKKQKKTHYHPEKNKFKLTANEDGHSDGPSEQGDSKKPAASSPEVFQLSMMDFRFSIFLS